jgi:hypothetical protein
MICWRGRTGAATLASVRERHNTAEELRAALYEACHNDADLVAAVRKSVA